MSPAQVASDRVASGSGTVMSPAADQAFADPAAPRGADAHRTDEERLSDPCVITEFRPGACPVARSEAFGGPLGPEPIRCLQGILRSLDRRPEAVVCDPDDMMPNRAWILAGDGDRLARITGLTPDQVNDALLALAVRGWEPNANREYGRPLGRSAADLMPVAGPARARQSRFL